MQATVTYSSYESTGYFSKIVTDYLSQSPLLRSFYEHTPDINGIKAAIAARKAFATPRALLVSVLQEQYASLIIAEKVKENIHSLADENTFTVTTAHQPNIFTGPLYFIYKIIHTIKLAETLQQELPQYRFVPVYYMGSEDADIEEIGQLSVGGQKLVWETAQTGAVGRMLADKNLQSLQQAIYGQIGVLPFGKELADLFTQCYTSGKTIQQATLELVNGLFASWGLIVLVPDNARLKKAFEPVVVKELTEGFSHQQVEQTIDALGKQYKVQAGGREINLFYLLKDKRERIEKTPQGFEVRALGLVFTRSALLQEVSDYPERFSANVILRGAFQETILPNIAFIGGGGELAYWLELKKVFEAVHIPYPVLLLRNSFLLMTGTEKNKLTKMGFSETDLFLDAFTLLNQLVKKESANQLNLTAELQQAHTLYEHLKKLANQVDETLADHVMALEKQATKKIRELEKKILRAERNKYNRQRDQIEGLKKTLFPGNSLQERVDNFSLFYGKYGSAWIQMLYKVSGPWQKGFGLVTIAENPGT